jgi:rubrerythrin
MPNDQINSVKYLMNCHNLESEVYLLYSTASKKLSRPELSCVLRALAQDSLKHAKVIEELFRPLVFISFENGKYDKNFNKLSSEIRKSTEYLNSTETIEDNEIPDLLKDLTKVEDTLLDYYCYFIDSEMLKVFANKLSTSTDMTRENLLFIMQAMKEDNIKHRNMLIESLFFFNKNKLKNKDLTPMVKFKNPDAWVQV